MARYARSLFVRQRIQTISALRGHLEEFGIHGFAGCYQCEEAEGALLASPAHCMRSQLICWSSSLNEKIDEIDTKALTKEDEDSRQSIPGQTASAAFRPPMENSGRVLVGSDTERGQHGRQGEA